MLKMLCVEKEEVESFDSKVERISRLRSRNNDFVFLLPSELTLQH